MYSSYIPYGLHKSVKDDFESQSDYSDNDDDDDDEGTLYSYDTNLRNEFLAVGIAIAFDTSEEDILNAIIRSRSRQRNRADVEKRMDELSDKLFKRMYRLDRPTFKSLLEKIEPKIENSESGKAFAKMTCGSEVTPTIKLAVTLRMLAGGSYLDIAFGYAVAPSTVYDIFHEVCEAIDDCVDNIIFPYNDHAKLKELEATFEKFGGDFALPGTVAAGDGVVFKIQKPASKHVNGNVEAFWSRKGFYGIGMQGFVDGDTKFVCISCEVCTSNHDSTAYIATPIYRWLHPHDGSSSLLPAEFHVVLDAAYKAGPQEHTPWKGRNLSQEKETYNYYLSLKRQCVERAFGLLVQRWGILWRPLRFSMEHICCILRVVCKLHNVCMDASKKETFTPYHEDMQWILRPSGDIPVTYPTWTDGTGARTGRGTRNDKENCPGRLTATNEIRDRNLCTQMLKNLGAKRPKVQRLEDKVPETKKRRRRQSEAA